MQVVFRKVEDLEKQLEYQQTVYVWAQDPGKRSETSQLSHVASHVKAAAETFFLTLRLAGQTLRVQFKYQSVLKCRIFSLVACKCKTIKP